MLRVCRHCGAEKPLDEFVKSKACKDGYAQQCRTCANIAKAASKQRLKGRPKTEEQIAKERARRREYYTRNKEAISAAHKTTYATRSEAEIAKAREARRARYVANWAAERRQQAEFRAANPELVKAWRRASYERTAESRRQSAREWYQNNWDRARQTRAEWAKANPGRVAAAKAARKKAIRAATPAWADMQAIADVYTEALIKTASEGVQYHVDHIVPIKSRLVCGLHVHWNMQVLLGSDNIRKSNRVWPDMP